LIGVSAVKHMPHLAVLLMAFIAMFMSKNWVIEQDYQTSR
jgi:hypothetical protein